VAEPETVMEIIILRALVILLILIIITLITERP
jgi:hypothetical protein